MMNWSDGGAHNGFPVFMGLFWIALIALIIFLVIKLLPSSSKSAAPATPQLPGTESSEQILDRLFATGEIDEQTYRARRTALAEMRKQS
jgi:putative membrane protein